MFGVLTKFLASYTSWKALKQYCSFMEQRTHYFIQNTINTIIQCFSESLWFLKAFVCCSDMGRWGTACEDKWIFILHFTLIFIIVKPLWIYIWQHFDFSGLFYPFPFLFSHWPLSYFRFLFLFLKEMFIKTRFQ